MFGRAVLLCINWLCPTTRHRFLFRYRPFGFASLKRCISSGWQLLRGRLWSDSHGRRLPNQHTVCFVEQAYSASPADARLRTFWNKFSHFVLGFENEPNRTIGCHPKRPQWQRQSVRYRGTDSNHPHCTYHGSAYSYPHGQET